MLIQNNDKNCAILDFKCTWTRYQQCEFHSSGTNIKCACEQSGSCCNIFAQRQLLLEILFPDTAELKDIEKNKLERKRPKKPTESIGINVKELQ